MLIVVTGPAYSGRISMAKALLDEIDGARALPIITTCNDECVRRETLNYTVVAKEKFIELSKDGSLLTSTNFGKSRFGILKEALADLHNSVGILACDSDSALILSPLMLELGIPTVCVYMHCSVRTMLFRRAAECHQQSEGDLDVVHDVYSDHSFKFSRIVHDSEIGNGFNTVIPVNSDRMSERAYLENVILPLASRLRAEASSGD